jgi:hypothetical protein
MHQAFAIAHHMQANASTFPTHRCIGDAMRITCPIHKIVDNTVASCRTPQSRLSAL